MKECFHLFSLYHDINKDQVIDIFKHFPYLFCCDMTKLREFLGEFRKYRFNERQIMNIVSFKQNSDFAAFSANTLVASLLAK